jgi:sterol desaturase/sphingolipid hydroxylase (fatty acid hydroxylase superfamily)
MASLIEYEIYRLNFRHFWLILGAFFFYLYVTLLPQLIYPIFLYLQPLFSPTFFVVLSLCLAHHTAFIIHAWIMYLIRILNWPVLEKYCLVKVWPIDQFPAALKTLTINFVIIVPMFQLSFYQLNLLRFRLDDYLPQPFEVASQIWFCMITEDIWSYFAHRLMHTPYFYSRIHKKHHEYKSSISYSAEYAHPVEYMLVNIMATGSGPLLLGTNIHFITFLTWIIYRIGGTLDLHSGYEFPWVPFSILPFACKI